jgi:hypothetical protein
MALEALSLCLVLCRYVIITAWFYRSYRVLFKWFKKTLTLSL